MDTRFSLEQQALRDSAAQIVGNLAARSVGELDDAERAAKLDAAVTGAGWRELRVDSGEGAPLASAVEVAIVAEELARGLADTPFVGPTLAAELRRLAGAPIAPRLETVVVDAGLASLARVVDDASLSGAVAIDATGCTSGLLLVLRDGADDVGQVGVTTHQVVVDLTRPSARVADDVLPLERLERAITNDVLTRWTALGLALTCADLVGTMRGAVELSNDYAKDRRQYGAPIGSFQAVQHLLADALVAVEGSHSVALYAAWAVDALVPADALSAGAVAKAYCSRAARMVCETAIQVHGGIGNTWECLAHVYLRRALLSIDTLGGVGANLARVLEHQAIGGGGGLR